MENIPVPNKYDNGVGYQANPIIEAQKNMTLYEGKLFYMALINQNPQLPNGEIYDTSFRKIFIKTEDLIKTFGVEGGGTFYRQLAKAADGLTQKNIKIKDDDEKNWTFISLFSVIRFKASEGGLTFKFTDEMYPYLLQLSDKPYTKVAGRDVFRLTSPYSIRVLELLLQYQNMAKYSNSGTIERNISLQEIREYMGILELKTYAKAGAIKQRILDTAKNDISKHTRYKFEYEVTRSGRIITGFHMKLIKPANDKDVIDSSQKERIKTVSEGALYKELTEKYGIGKIVARRLIENYSAQVIRHNIEYTLNQKKVKNLAGYIRRAIENDFYTERVLSKQAGEREKAHEEALRKERKESIEDVLPFGLAFADEPETESEAKKHLTDLEVECILNGTAGQVIMNRLKKFGLTVEDVRKGITEPIMVKEAANIYVAEGEEAAKEPINEPANTAPPITDQEAQLIIMLINAGMSLNVELKTRVEARGLTPVEVILGKR